MALPYSASEISHHLRELQQRVLDALLPASAEQFNRGDAAAWSAGDYLKHLLISVKPVARIMSQPGHALITSFGAADRPSRPYDQVERDYQARLAEGARAEDFPNVLPESYRFPEGVQDQQAHLIEAWRDANQRLIDAVSLWTEEELDRGQLPHPALGMVTMREMLFFTVIHNRLHAGDIERALAQ